ncbi:MAG: hypothetical protein IPM92_06820 [Saprospiraceae bacterium]|nr:hypothetical protein [Saprospiraceae bacterium]
MYTTQLKTAKALSQTKVIGFVCTLLFIAQSVSLSSQSNDPFGIRLMEQLEKPQSRSLFQGTKNIKQDVSNSSLQKIGVNKKVIQKILNQFNPLLNIEIPVQTEQSLSYNYVEYNFYTEEFEVNLIDQNQIQKTEVDPGIHLKGIPADGSKGFSSLSLFSNSIYGTFLHDNGIHYSVTPTQSQNLDVIECVFADERTSNWSAHSTGCHTDDIRDFMGSEINLDIRSTDQCKRVEISVHVDYDLYLKFNKNPQEVSNYVTGLFNNVHTLYKNEGISIALAQININTSEDYFSHISASSDLENFRKKYPNSNKTIKLLLSGYSKGNKAALGGIAYINTICNSSYSYAYGNVVGSYTQSPAYSWDVFVVAHELGHVFGSRHTHACAWGPNKNQAIDNCAKLEGTCGLPGIPKKGTMMSYCYLSNMPGIDFLTGFGPEPGALIRSTIQNASCLKSSAPEGKYLDTANTVITANTECSDGLYTHYYFDNNSIDVKDDILIVSIRKDSNDLGSIRDSSLFIQLTTTSAYGTHKAAIINADYVGTSRTFQVVNKYWTLKTSSKLKKPISVQYILSPKDVSDMMGSVSDLNIQDLLCFQILAPASIDPRTNHHLAKNGNFKSYGTSNMSGAEKLIYLKQGNGSYIAELITTSFENTGFGFFQTNTTPFLSFGELKASSEATTTNVEFQTNSENNCKRFVLEKSVNGLPYDSVQQILSKGSSQQKATYVLKINSGSLISDWLRVKAISTSGQMLYSAPFQTSQITPVTEEPLNVYPNPVSQETNF